MSRGLRRTVVCNTKGLLNHEILYSDGQRQSRNKRMSMLTVGRPCELFMEREYKQRLEQTWLRIARLNSSSSLLEKRYPETFQLSASIGTIPEPLPAAPRRLHHLLVARILLACASRTCAQKIIRGKSSGSPRGC